MANSSVTNVTTSSATIYISGLNTSVQLKQFVYYIKGPGDSDYRNYDIEGEVTGIRIYDGTHEYTYRNLNPGTYYEYKVYINAYAFPGGANPWIEEAVVTGWFETEGQYTEDPEYTFRYDDSSVNITVINADGYYIWYRVEDTSGTKIFDSDDWGRETDNTQLVTGLIPATTYWICVGYSSTRYGSLTYINGPNGEPWNSFTTDGAPGGTWFFEPLNPIREISQEISTPYYFSSRYGYMFPVSFSDSGTATLSLSGASGVIYITEDMYGFDESDGIPYMDINHYYKAVGSPSQTITVTADVDIFVWIIGSSENVTGTVYLTIVPPSITPSWTYDGNYSRLDDISTSVSKQVSISAYTGAYFIATFDVSGTMTFSTSGTGSYVYVTTGNYGWSSNGIPLDYYGYEVSGGTSITYSVTTSGIYYVWVRGADASASGQVTVTIAPPAPVGTGKVWIYTGSGWIQATPWVYTSSGWKQATPFIYTSSGWKKCT